METRTLAEICSYSETEDVQVSFRVNVSELKWVLPYLEKRGYEWMRGDKPTKWSPIPHWRGSGYLGFHRKELTQNSEPYGVEFLLRFGWESTPLNINPVEVKTGYCSCNGAVRHIKYISFEYDVCTSCKLEKER